MNTDLDLMGHQNSLKTESFRTWYRQGCRPEVLRWPVLGQNLPGLHSEERQGWVGLNCDWATFLTPFFLEL